MMMRLKKQFPELDLTTLTKAEIYAIIIPVFLSKGQWKLNCWIQSVITLCLIMNCNQKGRPRETGVLLKRVASLPLVKITLGRKR